MIENNGKEPLVLEHDFYVTFEVNHEIYDAWTTMLSPQANDFTDVYKRQVLMDRGLL